MTVDHALPEVHFRAILVPLNGSDFAASALPTARALADRFGATVHTITASVSGIHAEAARAEAARMLGVDPNDERVHLDTDKDVASAIARCATSLDPCLICIATHARGRVEGIVAGSDTRDVIAKAEQPVVVVGPLMAEETPEEGVLDGAHLVACVDGGEASEQVLPVAVAWARHLGMKMTIVTVAEPCPPPTRIGAPWRRLHGPNEDAEAYLLRLSERWSLESPGLETQVVYDPISPAAGMMDYLSSHPAGLIALASHLREGVPHLMLGSDAADIVHGATAPVLVVPIG